MERIIDRLLAYFSGDECLVASQLKVTQSAVRNWDKSGLVPFRNGVQIELVTEGTITCAEVAEAAAKFQRERIK